MGRNKKAKPTTVEELSSESEEETHLNYDKNSEKDSTEEEEEKEEKPTTKKKVYHGNKLNKGPGGKGKKEEATKKTSKQTVAGKDNDSDDENENNNNHNNNNNDNTQLQDELTDNLHISRNEPVEVLYCPICTFPAEMCEFSGMYEKCRPWLLEHAKELAAAEERGRKRRILTEKEKLERMVQGNGNKKAIERIVLIDVAQRKGRKMTTSVKGLDLFGLNLKDLSREWKKLFSCGAGVTTSEETKQNSIDIQGNVASQLIEILPERYNIPKESIYQMEDKKKVKCYPSS